MGSVTADKLKLGVLISGSGSNLQAIMDACAEGRLSAEVVCVVSDKEAAYGLERARKAHVPAVWVDRAAYSTMREYNRAVLEALKGYQADTVAMAGYMRLLGAEVLDAYPMRVLNIHPALLPSFAGAGGIHDAWEHGVKITGVTVHFANEVFDEGPIIAQEAIRIEEDDTVATLEEKIHSVEHRIYPQALQWLAEGRLRVEGRKVRIV